MLILCNNQTMEESKFKYQFYATTQEAWEAMFESIEAAKRSIYWEVYIFLDDAIGKRFIDALINKARQGVDIKMIVDAFGSRNLSQEAEEKLEKAGVDLLKYNRFFPELNLKNWLHRLMNRNHRKVLIVDESTAFLGGVNIDFVSKEWDDLYLKITGSMIRPLLRGFAKSYISAGGEHAKVMRILHSKWVEWKDWRSTFKFIMHSPRFHKTSPLKKLYLRGLALAQESVNLVTPYYLPDKAFLKALTDANRRGVKVNIFLPLRPDHKIMELLARAYFLITKKTGANLYFLPNMNHAKAMSVDDNYGVVGSVNLTSRSAHEDEEVSLTFKDANMVQDLNVLFNKWKDQAEAYRPDHSLMGKLEKIQLWLAKKMENYL